MNKSPQHSMGVVYGLCGNPCGLRLCAWLIFPIFCVIVCRGLRSFPRYARFFFPLRGCFERSGGLVKFLQYVSPVDVVV